MADVTLNVRHVQRNDTYSNWQTKNPILLLGEIAYEIDTNKFKIGDGVAEYNSLPYCTFNTSEIATMIDDSVSVIDGGVF